MRKIDHKIAYLLIVLVFLATGTAFAGKFVSKYKSSKSNSAEENIQIVTTKTAPVVEPAAKEEVAKAPPKHAAKQSVSTSQSGEGEVITIVTGQSPANSDDYLANCQASSAPTGVKVEDRTGRYSSLASVLRPYLNNLQWAGEINYFCGIFIEDAGDTGWSGQYIASYNANGTGTITSARGAVILNASYYASLSPTTFNEYMKLILSHEYGHHYTQYHKWIDLNLPITVRFPDSYYSVRPLSKNNTNVECTTWQSCESEIIAEDYSYLYSGYGIHQMHSIYGYPSTGTKTWLDNLASGDGGAVETPATPPAQDTTPEPIPEDTTSAPSPAEEALTISILSPQSPYTWTSEVANLTIQVRTSGATVNKIKFYVNDNYVDQVSAANVDVGWAYSSAAAGTYIFKAEAHSTGGTTATATLTITKQ